MSKSTKYTQFKASDKGGRGHTGAVGFKKTENYSGAAPRVGGTVAKSVPLKAASKSIIKASKKLTKGVGSGASKQAKISKRKLY